MIPSKAVIMTIRGDTLPFDAAPLEVKIWCVLLLLYLPAREDPTSWSSLCLAAAVVAIQIAG